MAINPILQNIQSKVLNEGVNPRRTINYGPDASGKTQTFGDMIKDAINSVDAASKNADQKVDAVVSGKSDDIPGAMIAMQKAQLSFQLMSEVRNKAIETYKQLSQMQM